MRQLTSLDAQFLAVESARTYGHVGGLAIYDPTTAPGRRPDRRGRLPPGRRAPAPAAPAALEARRASRSGSTCRTGSRIRTSTSTSTCASRPCRRRATTGASPRPSRGIFARPLDRGAAAVGAVPDPRAAGRARRAADEDPPLGRRRRVRATSSSASCSTRAPRGATSSRRTRRGLGERMPGDLEMLGRGMLGLPRQPLRALRSIPTALPNLIDLPGRRRAPGRADASAEAWRGVRGVARRAQPERPRGDHARRAPRTPFNGPHLGAPALRVRLSSRSTPSSSSRTRSASPSTTSSSRSAPGAVRDWLLDRDALPEDPLVAMVPVSVRTEEQRGTFGNRVSLMIVADPDRRAPTPRSGCGARTRRCASAKERHQRAAGRPAHRRHELHPAGGRRARGAQRRWT